MKSKFLMIAMLSMLGLGISGCNFSVSTNTSGTTANANKATPANSTANSTATAPKKEEKPTSTLKNEKKPDGESKKVKNNDVPKDWIYVYDETKGYGFSLPEGSTGESGTSGGVDTFIASTPAPSELGIVVIAFKNKELSKEDLLDVAVKFLEGMGETVTPGKLKAESDDYAVTDATTVSNGKKGKARILVGTDVTDNYVMIVGGDEDKFNANEKTIDEIWGSFEMWSGGSTGSN